MNSSFFAGWRLIVAEATAASWRISATSSPGILFKQRALGGAFAVRLPRVAREHGIRIGELTPTDESLESVFAYLVGG